MECFVSISVYYPPSPPSGQKHKYQFILYEEPNSNLKDVPDKRPGFNLNDFVSANDLKQVAEFYYTYQSP